MKRLKTILLLLGIAMLTGITSARCQERQQKKAPEHNRGHQAEFYRRTLRIDPAIASVVAEIQSEYKSGLSLVVSDSSLTDGGRRARIRELVESKNARLEKILSPAQQEKVIPTTERRGHGGPEEDKEKKNAPTLRTR